jgi:hypothetical protein
VHDLKEPWEVQPAAIELKRRGRQSRIVAAMSVGSPGNYRDGNAEVFVWLVTVGMLLVVSSAAYARRVKRPGEQSLVQIVCASQRSSRSIEHLARRMPPGAGGAQGRGAAAAGGRAG